VGGGAVIKDGRREGQPRRAQAEGSGARLAAPRRRDAWRELASAPPSSCGVRTIVVSWLTQLPQSPATEYWMNWSSSMRKKT
jgi:hypothetical protein